MSRDRAKRNAGVIAASAVMAACAWLLWLFFRAVFQANSSVQASIIAGIVALVSVIITFLKERSRSVKEAHRDKKIEVYSIFYDIVFSLLKKTKSGEKYDLENDPDFIDKWFKLNRGVLFYGSPQVVEAFANFKIDANAPSDPLASMRRIGRILLAMRQDIGLSNWGIDELSIHQVYVNDDVRQIGKAK